MVVLARVIVLCNEELNRGVSGGSRTLGIQGHNLAP